MTADAAYIMILLTVAIHLIFAALKQIRCPFLALLRVAYTNTRIRVCKVTWSYLLEEWPNGLWLFVNYSWRALELFAWRCSTKSK